MGGWSTSTDTLNITYNAEIKILGVTFARIIKHSMKKSWAKVAGKVRAPTRNTFERDLSLSQRIRYVQAIPPSENVAYGIGVPGTHDV